MSCDRDKIILYACNELEGTELEELEVHLETCTACQQYLEEFQQLSYAFTELPTLKPRRDVLASVLATQQEKFSFWNLIERLNPRLVAGLTVAILVISIVLPQNPPSESSVETPDDHFIWESDLDTSRLRHRVSRLKKDDDKDDSHEPILRTKSGRLHHFRHRIASIRKRQW